MLIGIIRDVLNGIMSVITLLFFVPKRPSSSTVAALGLVVAIKQPHQESHNTERVVCFIPRSAKCHMWPGQLDLMARDCDSMQSAVVCNRPSCARCKCRTLRAGHDGGGGGRCKKGFRQDSRAYYSATVLGCFYSGKSLFTDNGFASSTGIVSPAYPELERDLLQACLSCYPSSSRYAAGAYLRLIFLHFILFEIQVTGCE
ncbi:hypothetical protein J6590_007163 [Homalodisca vitripennis]|nr:hypothetical protein J6590_007163 [Homalodisca vitripennis]